MKGLQALFKIRETYIGIAITIVFQVIFFSVWMTAYDGVNDRTDNLNIGLISEDTEMGRQVVNEIKGKLPFTIKNYTSLDKAEQELNQRDIQMIIHIPSNFTSQLQAGKEAEIIYSINQANASIAKNMMDGVAKQLTEEINHNIYPLQQGKIIEAFSQKFSQLPMEQNTAQQINKAVATTIMSVKDHAINSTIMKTNNVEEFAANFVPLMVIISSFVGAMVMIMQHQQAAQLVQDTVSKWQLFLARQLINIGVAFALPLLTIGLMHLFNISSTANFLTVYLFQALLFWAFLCLAQSFIIIFVNLGMIFNICALSIQLVTSGALVPQAMLSNFYNKLGSLLPASYGADGYYTIIFGGDTDRLMSNCGSLGMIIVVTLGISAIVVALKKSNVKNEQTVPATVQ
ncbi:YhgE/Pip domain-containing protein [Lysinibacillus sp. BPa_S21]|uniref:YhgE/Pip domain-containing protein n=1 Tax=Lysinibacillus sp. BPa_S21 TaxID=2932478 RepID=UPI0020118E7C|nr:ABC transporter permease [Lysinibacillus sp. BPa_S21]MCL1694382.1 ABC transporter permease [Lysinibacillus sp. BPa_S21]